MAIERLLKGQETHPDTFSTLLIDEFIDWTKGPHDPPIGPGPVFIQPFQPVTPREVLSGKHYYGKRGCGCIQCAGA